MERSLIDFSVLSEAKGFLCWDSFEGLSIQLVPVQPAVAYFYPPQDDARSIVLFYDPSVKDLSTALFLLFHEAGHAKQWEMYARQGRTEAFRRKIRLISGPEKVEFEREAWRLGRELFVEFMNSHGGGHDLHDDFDRYARQCLQSYES